MLDLEREVEASLARIANEVRASDRLETRLHERVRSRRRRHRALLAYVGAAALFVATAAVVASTADESQSPAGRVTTDSAPRQPALPIGEREHTVVAQGSDARGPWAVFAYVRGEEICTNVAADRAPLVPGVCVHPAELDRRHPISWSNGGSTSDAALLSGIAWRGVERVELEFGGQRPRTRRVELTRGGGVTFFASTVPADATSVTLLARDAGGKRIFRLRLPFGDSPDVPTASSSDG